MCEVAFGAPRSSNLTVSYAIRTNQKYVRTFNKALDRFGANPDIVAGPLVRAHIPSFCCSLPSGMLDCLASHNSFVFEGSEA